MAVAEYDVVRTDLARSHLDPVQSRRELRQCARYDNSIGSLKKEQLKHKIIIEIILSINHTSK